MPGHTHPFVSIGRAGERYFLLRAGIDLDAEAHPRRVNPTLKRLARHGAFWVAGLRQFV